MRVLGSYAEILSNGLPFNRVGSSFKRKTMDDNTDTTMTPSEETTEETAAPAEGDAQAPADA